MPDLLYRLYYDDGSEIDNTQMAWDDAPSLGVIAFTAPCSKNGRHSPNSRDYYVRDLDGELYAMNWPGLWDHLDRVGHPEAHKRECEIDFDAMLGRVKLGRFTTKKNFERILIRANNDPDFPPRSARDRDDEAGRIPGV